MPPDIRPLARAFGWTAAATGVSLLASLATGKGIALLAGPAGLGLYGSLLGLLQVLAIVAGLGLPLIAAREAARSLPPASRPLASSFLRALLLAGLPLGVAATALAWLVLPDGPLKQSLRPSDGAWLAAGAAATALLGVLSGFLSAAGRLGRVNLASALASVGATAAVLGAVAWKGAAGLPLGLAAGALLGAAAFAAAFAGVARPGSEAPLRPAVLIRSALPAAAAMLAGSGAAYVLPLLVLEVQGETRAGYFRAATAASYALGLPFLNLLARDYYPKISGADVAGTAMRYRSALLLTALPLHAAMLLLAEPVLALLYRGDFREAAPLLRWILVGDFLRIGSWTYSFAVLARGGALRYAALEVVGGLALLVGVLVGMRWGPPGGPGLGVAAAYAVYLPTAAWLARKGGGAEGAGWLAPAGGALLAGLALLAGGAR